MRLRTHRFVPATLVLVATACAGAPEPPSGPTAEELFRQLFEQGLSLRDSAAAMEALAPRVVFHASGRTATLPREALWDLSRPILQGFPGIRFTVDQVVADGEYAAARISFVGTHEGEWGGIAPTGRRVTELFFCRIEAGKLAECWQEWDEHGLRQQLTAPDPAGG